MSSPLSRRDQLKLARGILEVLSDGGNLPDDVTGWALEGFDPGVRYRASWDWGYTTAQCCGQSAVAELLRDEHGWDPEAADAFADKIGKQLDKEHDDELPTEEVAQ